MPEPHSAVVIGALAGSVPAATLVLFGAHADALALGLFAAIFVSFWTQSIDNLLKSASAVLLSAMLAGYGSPIAAFWVVHNIAWLGEFGEGLRLLLAVLIGSASPSLVPIVLRSAGNKIGGAQ